MDQYFSVEGTPLKFHNFLKYVGLPFVAGLMVILLIANKFETAMLFFAVPPLILAAITLYGFYTWSPLGFYGVLAFYSEQVIYNIVLIIVSSASIFSLIPYIILTVCVFIYYCKRRPLFIPSVRKAFVEQFNQPESVSQKPVPGATVCKSCGGQINPGKTVCMRCGTAVVRTDENATQE